MQSNLRAGLGLAIALTLSAPSGAQEMTYRSNPGAEKLAASGIGHWVPDLSFQDSTGAAGRLSERMGDHGLIVAMRDPDCPLSKRYGPRTVRLEKEAAKLGFGLLFVEVVENEDALRDAKTYGFQAPLALDPDLEIAARLGARTSTEFFVLDTGRTLRYRGMLDDQYGLSFSRAKPQNTYLLDALGDLTAGRGVQIPVTQAQGCLLDTTDVELAPLELTYHNRISRIIQSNCMACHREGEVAPFTLDNYADVKRRKRMIKYALTDGVMPPWFASEESGPFSNDQSLSSEDLTDFISWLDGDSPEGNPEDAPAPKHWLHGWTIGEPDLIVEMPEPFAVPAEGEIDYEYFYAPTHLEKDTWIQGLEILAGSPEVVHHALVFIESPDVYERWKNGDRAARKEFGSGRESYFACMVPGQDGLTFPDGMAKLLPAGSWLKFQLHYTPNGTAQNDQSRIGLVFAKDQEREYIEVQTNCANNERFAIPAGAYAYEVTESYRFKEDATLLSLFPHTHLRGMRFLMELEYPNGQKEDLLDVPFYDFNWQLNYDLERPVNVPKGTKLRATAWYDNSEDNPANPDPFHSVRVGEQTREEMMIGYFNWVRTADLPQ